MWPSPSVAARVYDIANIALVVSLVVGVIATFLVVWMGAVKEKDSAKQLAALALQTAEANERAAKANEAAERERVERLKLEARLADRVLPEPALLELKAVAASFPKGTRIDIGTLGTGIEILVFAKSINAALTDGGWTVRQWSMTGGLAVRGVVIGTDQAKTATAKAGAKIVSVLVSYGVGAGEHPFAEMGEPSMRSGPDGPMDAPIRMYIGSKQ